MGDVSLADAIIKRIPGFDVHDAYQAIRKDAFELPPKGVVGVGRVCLESYEVNVIFPPSNYKTLICAFRKMGLLLTVVLKLLEEHVPRLCPRH